METGFDSFAAFKHHQPLQVAGMTALPLPAPLASLVRRPIQPCL
jgi:hypothetical protein